MNSKRDEETSNIRRRCVFCFHCLTVSSSSMYPLAIRRPMTLNEEMAMLLCSLGNIAEEEMRSVPSIFKRFILPKVKIDCLPGRF